MDDSDQAALSKAGETAEQLPAPQAPLGAGEQELLPEATLADLPEKLRQGAALAGWTELMPVQAKAIPYLFAQRDMMIQSRTGSGKTGAYLLPILEMINPLQRTTQALVLVPTRELALQVAAEAEAPGPSDRGAQHGRLRRRGLRRAAGCLQSRAPPGDRHAGARPRSPAAALHVA